MWLLVQNWSNRQRVLFLDKKHAAVVKVRGKRSKLDMKWQRGENIIAPNRWRGGDNQMKIGPAELAQWNGWETEGNRMTEGEMGGWRRGKGPRKENGKRGGGRELKNKAVAEKQEFMGSVAWPLTSCYPLNFVWLVPALSITRVRLFLPCGRAAIYSCVSEVWTKTHMHKSQAALLIV